MSLKLKAKEIRAMTPEERKQKLQEMRNELMKLKGGNNQFNMFFADEMKIRPTRRNVARILTIMKEKGEI